MLKRCDARMAVDLARGYSFTESNRRRMDRRVRADPDEAIGGTDQDIGDLQSAFLRERGLDPTDTLLDIGCGTLRGGQHFVDYLDAGNYVGLDISEEAIAAGRDRLGDLAGEKTPTLLVNDDLRFREINTTVDYAIAQSVWTHIPPESIAECLGHIGDVLATDGALYATFYPTDNGDIEVNGPSSFRYAESYLTDLASGAGLTAQRVPYDHPNGQQMLEVRR